MGTAEISRTRCGRTLPSAEFGERHQLVPRSKKGRETILVCVACGDHIHQLFTTKELERTFNSFEALRGERLSARNGSFKGESAARARRS